MNAILVVTTLVRPTPRTDPLLRAYARWEYGDPDATWFLRVGDGRPRRLLAGAGEWIRRLVRRVSLTALRASSPPL